MYHKLGHVHFHKHQNIIGMDSSQPVKISTISKKHPTSEDLFAGTTANKIYLS